MTKIPTMTDASGEVERLRAALQDIYKRASQYKSGPGAFDASARARAALRDIANVASRAMLAAAGRGRGGDEQAGAEAQQQMNMTAVDEHTAKGENDAAALADY